MTSVTANTFPLTIAKKPVYMYDVLIAINVIQRKSGNPEQIKLNKDSSSTLEQHFFHRMLNIAKEKSPLLNSTVFAYDGCAILYAPELLSAIHVVLETPDLPAELQAVFRHPVEIIVQKTNKPEVKFPFEINDLTIEHMEQFLAVVIAQRSYDLGHYFNKGAGFQYRLDESERDSGIELRKGVTKSFNVVGTKNQIGLELDVRVSAFYPSQTVLDFIRQRRGETSRFLKGATVSPTYSRNRSLIFDSVLDITAGQMKFTQNDGTQTTVAAYYSSRHNIHVPADCPLVSVKPRNAGTFPANLLIVEPFQKVPNERLDMTNVHSRNVIPARARYDAIQEAVDLLALNQNNPVLRAFGISVSMALFASGTIQASIHRPYVMAGGRRQLSNDRATFTHFGRYELPAQIGKWGVIFSSEIKPEIIEKLIGRLTEKSQQRGLVLPKPEAVVPIDSANFMTKAFVNIGLQMKDFRYLLYVESKRRYPDSHMNVKLVEPRYKIVVQQLDEFIVNKIVNGDASTTVDNVINKLNLKNGGLNFVPYIDVPELSPDKGVLVLSYQVAHGHVEKVYEEADGKKVRVYSPAVIGFSGNYSIHQHLFVGTYIFQQERPETEGVESEILTNHIDHILKRLAQLRPAQARPKTIVVLRDGISRYAYSDFADREILAIKQGCKKAYTDYQPKIIGLVATQQNTTRIFGPKTSDPTPGTIVDGGIVQPSKEFIIVSQRVLKGTAKPTKCVVVQNETPIPIASIQKFISSLSYSHQLTNGATGLPEPVYQAGILARRGGNLLKAFSRNFADVLPRDVNGVYDIRRLNNILSTRSSRLEVIRYTA